MTFQDKSLYHQIHPVKLLTDWSTGIFALYLLWEQNLIAALFVGLIPPLIVSLILVQFGELEKYKQSAFGTYISHYMTRNMQAIRFAGYFIMAIGAWYHVVWLIPLSLFTILFGWFRGVLFPRKLKEGR